MIEPRLTEQAEADLDELWARIATNNPDAADRMVDAVLESSRMHVRFPGMGQGRDDLRPGLRCFVVSPYVVFYRPMGDVRHTDDDRPGPLRCPPCPSRPA